jgi:hypothetical protein
VTAARRAIDVQDRERMRGPLFGVAGALLVLGLCAQSAHLPTLLFSLSAASLGVAVGNRLMAKQAGTTR